MTVQNLKVQIVRFADPTFPGWVAVQFVDVENSTHTVIDKWPIFTTQVLDDRSTYPCPGWMPCEVLSRWEGQGGRELARITTNRPIALESTKGISEFVVSSSQLTFEFPEAL